MMSRLRVFYRLIVRPLYREPARTLLTVLAVALGVAVVLAIELAGDAAAGSFRSSIETLTGSANLEVTAVGGVPDNVVATLATLPYPIKVEPRIDDFATIPSTGQSIPLVGLDLIADHPEGFSLPEEERAGTSSLAQTLTADNVWVSSRLGAKPGDTLRLLINDEVHPYTVRGVLKDSGDTGGLILMDIGTAQRALNRANRVDRIPDYGFLRHPPPHSNGSNDCVPCCRPALNYGATAARAPRIARCSAHFVGTCGSLAMSRWWSAHFSSSTPSRCRSCAAGRRSASHARWAPAAPRC